MGEIPRRSKKNFSVGMTIVNWWLSDPLFLSGVYRSQVEIDFQYTEQHLNRFRIAAIALHGMGKIPRRGYRLARNG